MSTGDTSKLPKWAQEKIQQLEMRLKEVIEDRAEIYAGFNDGKVSPIKVEGHMSRPNIYLPAHSTVTFILMNGEEVSVSFNYGRNDFDYRMIHVRTDWREAVIIPAASNCLNIGTKESIHDK